MQPSHLDLQRDVGRVEGAVAAMEKRLDRFEENINSRLDCGLREIKSVIGDAVKEGKARHDDIDTRLGSLEKAEERRKGWLAATATIATAVSSAIVWLANKIF